MTFVFSSSYLLTRAYFKGPCYYLWPIWIIEFNLPILRFVTFISIYKGLFTIQYIIFTFFRDQGVENFGAYYSTYFRVFYFKIVLIIALNYGFCILLSLPFLCVGGGWP